MTKPGQCGDFLRLQGTLEYCLLKAVKLIKEVEMDEPQEEELCRGGGLSDAEEQ